MLYLINWLAGLEGGGVGAEGTEKSGSSISECCGGSVMAGLYHGESAEWEKMEVWVGALARGMVGFGPRGDIGGVSAGEGSLPVESLKTGGLGGRLNLLSLFR